MIIAELERQKAQQKEILINKFGLSQAQAIEILNSFDTTLEVIIQKMKEGKSAHEKFFSDIILKSIDGIIGFDNDFKVFLWNKGAERMFGYTKEEVMGNDFEFLIPKNLLEKGEKEFLINEVKEKGFLENYETKRLTKNRVIVNVSVSRFEIFNEKNELIGSVGILRDITAVKKLQKELREKENLALIGEVVSSIAHSLSNPLNIISGNADFLMLNKKEDDNEYEELKTIVDETTRITRSIRHLLNFSRPIHTNKIESDINDILSSVSEKSKFLKSGKEITIKKNLAKTMPLIKIDKAQIEEVIMNIVTNAIQAIHKKGEIKLKSLHEAENIIIEITDNGQGIPKENLEKIFMPFFSSKEYGKGTGLGLSIAKRVIHEHGGTIKVKSTQVKGTTFTISLPVK
jgi:PAS domain S-box-containing protein